MKLTTLIMTILLGFGSVSAVQADSFKDGFSCSGWGTCSGGGSSEPSRFESLDLLNSSTWVQKERGDLVIKDGKSIKIWDTINGWYSKPKNIDLGHDDIQSYGDSYWENVDSFLYWQGEILTSKKAGYEAEEVEGWKVAYTLDALNYEPVNTITSTISLNGIHVIKRIGYLAKQNLKTLASPLGSLN